uniref:Transmembrane emp24 domain-containing protein B n=3 Tax=Lygus hesperus TaxID=30085 RepID=A0A0A9Z5N9_LYGHE
MQFYVISGGLLDIQFTLVDPSGEKVEDRMAFFNHEEEQTNEQEGLVKKEIKHGGVHEFCFSNEASRWTEKIVTFQMISKRASKVPTAKLSDLASAISQLVSFPQVFSKLDQYLQFISTRFTDENRSLHNLIARSEIVSCLSLTFSVALLYVSYTHMRKWFPESHASPGV